MKCGQITSDFERDGVVRVRELFSHEEVEQIRQNIDRYIRDVMPTLGPSERVMESGGGVRNLWRMEKHDGFFARLVQRGEMLELVEKLVHGPAVIDGVETFNKPAETGSEVPYHQDNAYFCQRPPDMLTIWVAIDRATAENGAIRYIRGSHSTLLPHKVSGVKGNSLMLADPSGIDSGEEFLGELEPGDALFHHSQTIHRSEPNRSKRPRLGLLIVCHGAHTETDPALRADYDTALESVYGTV